MSSTIGITYIILILIIITVVFVIYTRVAKTDMVYVKSDLDSESYLVRNTKDKKKAANLLASIKADILHISEYLNAKLVSKNKADIEKYQPNAEYIKQLKRNLKNVVIKESAFNTVYTSYTVNKGESIVFCIRSKDIASLVRSSTIHNKNLVMYVALHEIAHVACPEYGHTELFKKIFKFITETAMDLDMYQKVNFDSNPVEYCGMMITDSIV
jgi:Mimiviridae putative metallopeptidase WLM domain protein